MAGLYIHVPFCRQACRYCDFFFNVSLQYRESYVTSLLKEIQLRKQELSEHTVTTLYFGGGTPSVLTPVMLKKILDTIYKNYRVASNVEVTLEANPDDLSVSYLDKLNDLGFNRLSIGIQSYREKDLELMRRSHTARQAKDCIHLAEQRGFSNINMDLIYGIPGLTVEAWMQNLETALKQPITHLSAYHLTYEPGTVFHHWRKKGRLNELPEDTSILQYSLLREKTKEADFEHYEISNFCKTGFRSVHNTTYWNGDIYLGLGPSAHSYNGDERRWNVGNLKQYISGWKHEKDQHEKEILSPTNRYNDYMITSLRTAEGMNYETIKEKFGNAFLEYVKNKSEPYIRSEEIRLTENGIKMTPMGWFRSDMIMEAMMIVDED